MFKENNKNDQLNGDQNKPKKISSKFVELLNRNFNKIAFSVSILVLIIGYILVISPKFELKNNKNIALFNLEMEVKALESNSQFLSKYSDQLIGFTPEEEKKLSLALPDNFDLPSIIIQLSKLASDHRFVVENIEAEEINSNGLKSSLIKRVDIRASISGIKSGDYDDFYRFIGALESSLMIFNVQAISFDPQNSKYQIELSTYYYPKQ